MPEPTTDRRSFLRRSAALAVGLSSLSPGADALAALVDDRPGGGSPPDAPRPHARLRSVVPEEVRWTRGFWADRFAECRDVMVPAMWELMSGTEPSQFFHNFKVAAGLVEGRHRGPSWNDGDFYKWLEAASTVYAVTRDPAWDRRIDEIIRGISLAQRDDGYLHTPVLIKARNGDPDARPLQDKLDFEAYNLGHLITAACVHHRATGKDNLLKVAIKAADYLVNVFRAPTPELARNAVCPSHYMGIVDLYRTTHDPRYLGLARTLIDIRALVEDGTDDNQDRVPFRRQSEAAGHAVRANYLYAGVADVYQETGDRTLLDPLLAIWDDVANRKMAITGACGALFDGASPDGSKDQKSITRIHQAYGRPYQLPNSTAHNETCAGIGNALWNQRMLEITGEARFADVVERVLYNANLAGISLDGRRFFYVNTLRQLDRMPVNLRWSRDREAFISCFCCPPNVVRTVAETGAYAYGKAEGKLWVHLYGGNTLDTILDGGERLRLTQQTEYPWDGRVRITIDQAPGRPCSLSLRIPGWAREASLRVNGTPWAGRLEPGTYAEVDRAWSSGDVLELDLPMPVRLLEAHPLVEETRNQVAVQRGPIVYCLESVDLPSDVKLSDVVIPHAIALKPRYDPALLSGVAVLEGRAQAWPERDWSNELYRDLADSKPSTFDVKLVPYYAWGNRGHSEMTVWMPLGR